MTKGKKIENFLIDTCSNFKDETFVILCKYNGETKRTLYQVVANLVKKDKLIKTGECTLYKYNLNENKFILIYSTINRDSLHGFKIRDYLIVDSILEDTEIVKTLKRMKYFGIQ